MKKRNAFTLVEILIVVVIMAVLAATIIPQFSDSTSDAKAGTSEFNLHTLRSQIQLYKSQHDGLLPTDDMAELIATTDKDGNVGSGAGFVYGPYVREIPANSFSNSNDVKEITTSPAEVSDVTAGNAGGWLYNKTSGELFIDHSDHFSK